MGKLKTPSAWFIADANVLIDYANTAPAILGQVSKHIGPVYVAADVLEEVDQLDDVIAIGHARPSYSFIAQAKRALTAFQLIAAITAST